MPLMIYKPARFAEVDGRRRRIGKHEQWLVPDGKDFSTRYGVVKAKDLAPGRFAVKGAVFIAVPASFIDSYKAMERGPQIITRKDLGFLIGYCGITPDHIVVESGAGSGGATAFLARVAKSVSSYEIDEEHLALAKRNVERLGLLNVEFTHGDFTDPSIVGQHGAQFCLLDLPEPWRAYESAKKALALGGYLVAYTPSIVQAQRFANELPEEFLLERTAEILQRNWKVDGDAVRPLSTGIGHTAFLSIARRVL